MNDIHWYGWLVLGLSALIIGVGKTGLPGVGILAIPLVAMVIPAKESTGLILPMLIVGDVFAVAYYRRHAVWAHLVKLLPFAVVGIVIGWRILQHIDDRQLRPFIGVTILVMLGLNWWRTFGKKDEDIHIPRGWWFAAVMGLIAGVMSMMANAAGPIMVIYLLAMRLPKNEFIGTGAWYFLLINWLKVPFSASVGLIGPMSLTINLAMLPVIVFGALAGVRLARWVPEQAFETAMQVIAAVAAVKLIF